jgi:alkylation response protein AidB-like acyl-CoA dehydrogenase|tara:strand:- start:1387 stop:2535 length:1149 start_codon:yes stop_codon:yes gene_type:complete
MNFDAENEQLILDAVDKFLIQIKPSVRQLEADDEYPEEIVAQMKEMGLFGAVIDPEYGGLGLPVSVYAKIVEKIACVWMSLTGVFNSHLIMAMSVQRFGTEEQKRKWLPLFASGEMRGALALTEPNCGTDLQAIKSTAQLDGDEYIINGSKTWITNSLHGSCFALLVKTDSTATPAHKGMSLFIAPKGEGFVMGNKLKKLGYKGVDTAEFFLENYRLPSENLIGLEEGHGLQHALGALALGRINVAARGIGVASAALNDSIEYSQQRKTFGKPICQHQSIQIYLADMATRVEAARLLVQSAAAAFDRGERCDMEAGMAKLYATEAAMSNSAEALRIHGAYGYSTEFNVERYYRDAPLLAIGEGTNELQRIIIAKQLIEQNPL